MSVLPLGVLKETLEDSAEKVSYDFVRGIEAFPTVGDPVLIPTQDQLKAIVESGSNRRVNIGISPLAGNAIVSIDPDRLLVDILLSLEIQVVENHVLLQD